MPYATIMKAYQLRDDLDALQLELELDFPNLEFGREETRQLVAFATAELEKDRLAATPSSVEPLERKINRALSEEVDRIQLEMRALQQIVVQKDGLYKMKHSEERLDPEGAQQRLILHTKRLLEIKKLLVDQRKADVAAQQTGVLNMQINVGDLISETLSNIKKASATECHAVVDAQVRPVTE